ncbi:uncharacterized protein METZ01_LOCUS103645 [marine metagenome]|uniref:3-oxo-5-alpha-steroid 4-dehydrogenase C-terminal domain-containing protein n=1 Tax=marine metagenome TaxID=408172 RepID=A0A381WEQ1_9ZZZZ
MCGYNCLLAIWTLIGFSAICCLFFVTAPYGRHEQPGWGRSIPSRLGWILMESPAFYIMLIFFLAFRSTINLAQIVLFALWALHYFHRSFIWPFRAKISRKKIPALIVLMAFIFNCINTSFQGIWIFSFGDYTPKWIYGPQFFLGLCAFLSGMYINVKSDNILMALRRKNGPGYHIPKGFLFEKVSSPNYLGELTQWLGWAIMTWSLAGLVFFLWSLANLLPRAIAHHRWYKETFDDYPDNRKILVPGVF